MSNTYIYRPPDSGGEIRIFHNSDLSGSVSFNAYAADGSTIYEDVEIPGAAIIELVADFVRLSRISEIENMPDLEILGVAKRP
jgi:hypothetical protein